MSLPRGRRSSRGAGRVVSCRTTRLLTSVSRAQRIILAVGAAALVLALLFPAWATGEGITLRVLTRPIWSPPPGAPLDGIANASMAIRLVVIAAATAAAWLALGLKSQRFRARRDAHMMEGHPGTPPK